MQVGDFVMYTSMLAFMVAPVVQVVNIGTQISEALAGLERTRQILEASGRKMRIRTAR